MIDARTALRGAVTFVSGVITGRFVDQLLTDAVGFSRLDGLSYARVHDAISFANMRTMLPLGIAAATSLLALAVWDRDAGTVAQLTWFAAGCAATELAITFAFFLPLNAAIEALLSGPLPPGWRTIRDRWVFIQGLRTGIILLEFSSLLVAWRLRPASRQPQIAPA